MFTPSNPYTPDLMFIALPHLRKQREGMQKVFVDVTKLDVSMNSLLMRGK